MRPKTKFTEPPEIVEAEKKIIEYFTKIDPERFGNSKVRKNHSPKMDGRGRMKNRKNKK